MRYLVRTARPIFEDLVGTFSFYLLFVLTESAAFAAMTGFVIGAAQAIRHRMKGEPVPGLLLIGLALTISLGGLSILTHSSRFLLLKPSIIYCCIGSAMVPRGWVRRYIPQVALDLLPPTTWDRVGWTWSGLMFLTAAANIALVASLSPHQAAALFILIATGLKLALFAVQYGVLRTRAARAYRARLAGDAADA